jgi:CBS domain-containing protein
LQEKWLFIMEDIVRILQSIPPFHLLSSEQLERIANVIQIEYFPTGHDVMVHNGPVSEYLYIIQRGSVDLLREDEDNGVQIFDTLDEGELFGYPSLIRRRPPIVTVRTREETLLYLLPADTFHHLRRDVPSFARFFASSVIERISHRLKVREASASPELFRLRLGDIMAELVSAPPDITLRQAAQIMSEHKISSLVITSDPPGIITDRDFRNKVLARGINDTTPVKEVMTTPVIALPADSLVFEALMTMLEHGFHHMPVTNNGQVVGLVTHTDIMRQQSKSPLFLPRQLERARNDKELRSYADQVMATAGSLLDEGARVSDIGRVVALAHDALVVRLIQDAEQTLGSPPCPYAWLLLGSEGRYEQILRTDQDNALVYADDAPPEAGDYFTQLAEYVIDKLLQCGFPPCPGNVMATNPQWRQPLAAWQEYFQEWIDAPRENTLLRIGVFFDYRKVYGTLDVDSTLRPVIKQGAENRIFLGRLSRVAIRHHAPVSFFRKLVVERSGEERNLLDLKARGTGLIVDLARLFALEVGCHRTNTVSRLRQCTKGGSSLSPEGAEELIAAFEMTSLLRLRYQYEQMKQGKQPATQVPVSWLSVLERRELKEALWAVARIQRSIELEFQTELFSR